MKKSLDLIMALCAFSTTSLAADLASEEERTNLIMQFDKNKDKALDTKELGDIKKMKPKAHMVLVDYCKLLKAKPENFGVKVSDMKAAD